ncbi:OmpA family protein [Parvibaculum sp.]|jgi:outer membrane protein OmpA-like peptidoglycan-associated protein|uniref:OmpA family protein n=1 Tax=Parvibaculum sp. TaxID=2024848 RepID=UPI001B16E073|nr:OmpA family protein [Parvibaculum sp.]MBO6633798.1 OmpA family protein [Parvibaculum sp.]MBO6679475.1 OmpA family protein [Parvibaculum sp.]MBO6685600.1 OmpA family protein [Parvibaculum sp.]
MANDDPKNMNSPAENRSVALLPKVMGNLVLAAALFLTAAAHADPLSPVGNTLEEVTGTVGGTVSGAGDAIRKTTGTVGNTVTGATRSVTENPIATTPGNLGRDISQPVGILSGPEQRQSAGAQQPFPSGTARTEDPGEYRPYDVYRNDLPDTLGRGTLARIYFEPGEATLNGGARNRIAGFAQNFSQRTGNVEIRGFADRSSGDDAQASDLALRRAHAVQQALLEHGIGSGRIRASGMGNISGDDAAEDRVDILFDGY